MNSNTGLCLNSSNSKYLQVVYEGTAETKSDEELEQLQDSAVSTEDDEFEQLEESPVTIQSDEFDRFNLTRRLHANNNSDFCNVRLSKFMWCSEYVNDIYCSLLEIENNRYLILNQSPQLHLRPPLINLIKATGESLRLCKTTVHLAVYLLDMFMDTHEIPDCKVDAVALSSIFVASKVEECDYTIPRLQILSIMGRTIILPQELKEIEIQILDCCKWYVLYPTAATFLESFMTRILTIKEANKFLIYSTSKSTFEQVLITIKKLAFDYLDLVLEDLDLVGETPSLVSAACIAAARKDLGVKPVWNERLFKVTYYSYFEIKNAIKKLMKLMRMVMLNNMFKDTPDSGILSDYSCSDSDSMIQGEMIYEYSVPYKKLRT